ncbi:MAG: hypothetical protein ACLRM8_05905 [Alistipes sp.]
MTQTELLKMIEQRRVRDLDLTGRELKNIDFKGCRVENVTFDECTLTECNFDGCGWSASPSARPCCATAVSQGEDRMERLPLLRDRKGHFRRGRNPVLRPLPRHAHRNRHHAQGSDRRDEPLRLLRRRGEHTPRKHRRRQAAPAGPRRLQAVSDQWNTSGTGVRRNDRAEQSAWSMRRCTLVDMLNVVQTTIGILLTGIFGSNPGNKTTNKPCSRCDNTSRHWPTPTD